MVIPFGPKEIDRPPIFPCSVSKGPRGSDLFARAILSLIVSRSGISVVPEECSSSSNSSWARIVFCGAFFSMDERDWPQEPQKLAAAEGAFLPQLGQKISCIRIIIAVKIKTTKYILHAGY